MTIKTILIDLNGTLAVNGVVDKDTSLKIKEIKEKGFRIILVTSDHRGNGVKIAKNLGIEYEIAKTSDDKALFASQIDKKEHIASIGNARVDIGLFENSELSIATMQAEGMHTGIIKYVDIIVPSIIDAFNLFSDENSLQSTLKR